MYPLAILLIGAGFFVLGLRRRARLGRPLDRPFATKLVSVSSAGASTLILAVYPALHVVFWHWMRGAPLEANLPIGYTTGALILLLVLGAATGGYALVLWHRRACELVTPVVLDRS